MADYRSVDEDWLIKELRKKLPSFDYPDQHRQYVEYANLLASPYIRNQMIDGALGTITPIENIKSASLNKLEKLTGLNRNDTLIDDAYNSFWNEKFSPDDLKQPIEYWKQYFVPKDLSNYKPSKTAAKDTERPLENILKALKLAIGYNLP